MQNYCDSKGIPCGAQHGVTISKRLSFIESCLEIDKDKKLLDIGVGHGAYLTGICERVGCYVGVDVEGSNLKVIQNENQSNNVCLVQNVAENLPFRSNSFDSAIMIEVLEHVDNDVKSIREISRVLKRGGDLIITAPNKYFPFETHGFRIGSRGFSTKGLGFPLLPYLPELLRSYTANAKVYTPSQLKKLLIQEGFSTPRIDFLAPGLDQLKANFPQYATGVEWIQSGFDRVERFRPINSFLTTIIIHARKMC